METFKKNKALLSVFLILYLLAALNIVGPHHADEHYQILEFLSAKFHTGNFEGLTWEYHEKIRPWFQVYLFQGFFSTFHLMGITSPFTQMTLMRVLFVVLSFWSLLKLYEMFEAHFSSQRSRTFFLISSFALWFFPYLFTRTSSENLSSILFVWSYLLFFRKGEKSLWLSGLFFGLTFCARFQMAVVVFFLCLWALVYKKKTVRELFIVTLSCLLTIGVGTLLDSYAYGSFQFAPWNYFYQNIVMGVMSGFSEDPWWYYFYQIQKKALPVIGAVIVLSFLTFWIKRFSHPLTWVTLSYVVFHSLISHKEYRFLFPIAVFTPYVLTYVFDFCYQRKAKLTLYSALGFLIANSLIMPVSSMRPAFKGIRFYQYLNENVSSQDKIFYTSKRRPNEIITKQTDFYQIGHYNYELVRHFDQIKEKEFLFHTWKGKEYLEISKDSRCEELFPKLDFVESFFLYGKKRKTKEDIYALFKCQLL